MKTLHKIQIILMTSLVPLTLTLIFWLNYHLIIENTDLKSIITFDLFSIATLLFIGMLLTLEIREFKNNYKSNQFKS